MLGSRVRSPPVRPLPRRQCSNRDENHSRIGTALVFDRYQPGIRKSQRLGGEYVAGVLSIEKSAYVVLALIFPACGKHGALYHRRPAGRTIPRYDSENIRPAAAGGGYDAVQLRQRIIDARSARMQIILRKIWSSSHAPYYSKSSRGRCPRRQSFQHQAIRTAARQVNTFAGYGLRFSLLEQACFTRMKWQYDIRSVTDKHTRHGIVYCTT